MRSFLLSRRFLKDRRLPEGKGGPFGAPSALSVYIVLLRKGMSQWFGMGPLCGPGSEGSKGSACLWQAGSECGGGGSAAGCVEGLWKKVLKMDRPFVGGFLSLTALRAEGCGLPLRGSPLSGCAGLSPQESVSHDSQVALLPYESCSLATPSGGQNKSLYAFL